MATDNKYALPGLGFNDFALGRAMMGPENIPAANDEAQRAFIRRISADTIARGDGAMSAIIGLETLMRAQTTNVQVTFQQYYSRVSIRAATADATGLVRNPTFSFFASGNQQAGSNAGFTRALDAADTNLGTASFLPANRAFIGFQMGIRVNPNMPRRTADTIMNRSTIKQTRGNLTYNYGRALDWPCGQLGVASQAAATTNPNTQITYNTNGLSDMCQLPSDGRVYFAPKQEVNFILTCFGSFYVTTNGEALDPDGNNALIPNNGEQDESQGYLELVLRGYEIVQPG